MSPESKRLLEELKERPEWKEILDEIKEPSIKGYQPIKSNNSNIPSPEVQERNWIFNSGRAKERTLLLTLLTNGEINE